jgi:hypothetical protein
MAAGCAIPPGAPGSNVVTVLSEVRTCAQYQENCKPLFYVFDLMFQGREDMRMWTLSTRKHVLEKMVGDDFDGGRVRYVEHHAANCALSSDIRTAFFPLHNTQYRFALLPGEGEPSQVNALENSRNLGSFDTRAKFR